MRVRTRPPIRARRARSAAERAAEVECRTTEDLDAWHTTGDRQRLRAAVHRYLLGPRVVWSDDVAERVRQTLRDLYDRAESVRLPRAKSAREMTAGEARRILGALLSPRGSGGRPSGSAPIIAHAVDILVMLSDGRSVDALLDDDTISVELRTRLVELEYDSGEIDDLLFDRYDTLVRAYGRRVRGK